MPASPARLVLAIAAGATALCAGLFGWAASGALEARAQARVEAMARAAGLDWLVVEVDGLRVRLSGTAPDAVSAASARAVAAASGGLARVVDDLRVAPASAAPRAPALTLSVDARGLVLTGLAPSPVARARLVEAAPAAVEVRAGALDAGAPEPAGWRMLEAAALAALPALGEGSVTVSEGVFSVSGDPRSAADRAAIEALAAGLVAEGVAVSLDLAETEPAAAAPLRADAPPAAQSAAAAWLRVKADPSLVVLTGAAPDEATRDAVIAYAGALFGVDRLHPALALSGAPGGEGWRAAALAVVSALALLETGEAKAAKGVARVEGVAARPEAAREAHDALTAAEAAGWRATSRITVDLPGRAAAARLPLALCAERLTEITAGAPILFAPASAEIEADSKAALDRLADILARCAGGRIAVEGHTDSQGSAGYNLRLSQERAEAVLAALVERGAPRSKLVARGYGQERPIADNATEEGRARNRRIAFAVAPDADDAPSQTDADRSAAP